MSRPTNPLSNASPALVLFGLVVGFYLSSRGATFVWVLLGVNEWRFDVWRPLQNAREHLSMAVPYFVAAVATGWTGGAILGDERRLRFFSLAGLLCGAIYFADAYHMVLARLDWATVFALSLAVFVLVVVSAFRGVPAEWRKAPAQLLARIRGLGYEA